MTSVSAALSYSEDAIGIGRKGTIDSPYVLHAPFWTVDTLFYSIPRNGFDLDFAFCLFLNTNWKSKDESSGLPSLSKQAINSTIIRIPGQIEQRLIGALFRDVDDLITLRQRELEHTKSMKRGLLQKMFPKAGSDAPELRFPGFTDPWEQRKLGEFYRKGDEKNSNLEFGIEKTISVSSMSWNPNGNGAAENSLSSYKILRKGDIAFEGNRTKGHPYGKLVINDIGAGIMSSRFRTLAAKEPMCIPFWKPFLTVDSVFRRIYINCTKRGTLMTELVVPELLESTVPIPSLSEQRLIGALFRDVDDLITLRQRELEHTKLMKKALLQQMFV